MLQKLNTGTKSQKHDLRDLIWGLIVGLTTCIESTDATTNNSNIYQFQEMFHLDLGSDI